MRKTVLLAVACGLLAAGVQAAEVKIYPGAKVDAVVMKIIDTMKAKADPETKAAMGDQTVYVTPDGFDKVFAFYKKLYPETDLKIKKKNVSLPGGKFLNDAYFCLDGTESIAYSKFWLKIQNPYIGKIKKSQGKFEYDEIKNITVITIVEKP